MDKKQLKKRKWILSKRLVSAKKNRHHYFALKSFNLLIVLAFELFSLRQSEFKGTYVFMDTHIDRKKHFKVLV